MNGMPAEHHCPRQYELRIGGHLDSCWAEWFEGMVLTRESDATTTLCGPVVDQAALHGILAKVRDIGATLIAVNPVGGPTYPAAGAQVPSQNCPS